MGIAAMAAIALLLQGGWASRFSERELSFAAASSDYSPVRAQCIADTISDHSNACHLGSEAEPTAMVWGDSHAVELAWVLGERFGARGEAILQRTRGSCAPALGFDPAKDPRCALFNNAVFEELTHSPSIRTVYLAGYWEQDPYRNARIDVLLDQTITLLQQSGKEVVLIGPIPTQDVPVPRLLALWGTQARTLSVPKFRADTDWFTQRFADWRARGVTILEPLDSLSADGRTIIVAGESPLYYDDHHLSLAGARHVLAALYGE